MPAKAKPEPSPLTREIAAIIKGQLVRHGIEQRALATAMGVSEAQASRMLNGKKHWDIEHVTAACELIGLNVISLIDQAQEPVKEKR